MKIKQTLESIARGLALAGVLASARCSQDNNLQNIPLEDRELYSQIYNMTEEEQKDYSGDIEQYLEAFSANKRRYLEDAEKYKMDPNNLSKKARLFLVVSRLKKDIAKKPYKTLDNSNSPTDPNQKDDGF